MTEYEKLIEHFGQVEGNSTGNEFTIIDHNQTFLVKQKENGLWAVIERYDSEEYIEELDDYEIETVEEDIYEDTIEGCIDFLLEEMASR